MDVATTYIKRKSQKQEKRTAKEFNGRTQVASGALSGAKGDVRTGQRSGSSFNQDDFLIENKFTDKSYYKLDIKIWEKIAKEALRDNFRTPLMQIDIQDFQIVVMDKEDFHSRDIDVTITATMYTTKKSTRLIIEELEEMLQYSDGIYLHFDTKEVDKYLVIMKKEKFLDLQEDAV